MAVQFILGRSGTGKTYFCLKQIVEALLREGDCRPLIMLVPEQATYQAEQAILADGRISGYSRLNVLSFNRLGFLLLGKNNTKPILSRTAQQMIIHRILRQNADKLKVLGSSAGAPGLSRQVAETITELQQYAATEEDIGGLWAELGKNEGDRLTALKFADIGLIFGEYLKFIEGRFIDSDAQLNLARGAAGRSEMLCGAKVWVDGFSGFTASELAMLGELLKAACDSKIALCMDASAIDLANPESSLEAASLFSPTEKTYAQLVEMIKKCKLKLSKPMILREAVRFKLNRQLGHVEGNIFEKGRAKTKPTENVRVVSAADGRAEVKFVARQILKLVKDEGLRYRDIAVVASDVEAYEHYLRAYFEDYGIPFFIDKPEALTCYPVARLIHSALQAVIGGFSNSDIFAYLKTGLVAIEEGRINVLENYCVGFGIRQGDWLDSQRWEFAGGESDGFDEEQIDRTRREAIGPLLKIRDSLCPADEPSKVIDSVEFTRVVFEFLDSLGIREKIGEWIEQAAERKDAEGVERHRQFFSRLVDLFDELCEVFGDESMSCQDLFTIVDACFSQLKLALIPPTLDQVLVGSIERSRHPDLKAVFLIGATQKQFPMPIGGDSILSDQDRRAAEGVSFSLAATTYEKLAQRQYLAYIAFTRPSRFLYVSYPAVDNRGSLQVRSQFVENLQELFDGGIELSAGDEQIEIERVFTENELAEILCGGLGGDRWASRAGDNEKLDGLLVAMRGDEGLSAIAARVSRAVGYDNCAGFKKGVAEKLFGRRIRSSASALSCFAACPYQYFSRYTLGLKERKEFKLQPLDLGLFYHKVLDAVVKKLRAEGEDIATIEEEALLKLVGDLTGKVISRDTFLSNFVRHSGYNTFIIDCAAEALENCVLEVARKVRAGCFRPMVSEAKFGEGGKGFGEYGISLGNGRELVLRGKIDRIDTAIIDGEKTAIIFDYKRGDKSFSWSDLYHGLDMQLAIYLLAVQKACRGEDRIKNVVGAFYMPVEIKIGKVKSNYKAKGIFNGEFFEYLDSNAETGRNPFYKFYLTSKKDQYGDYGRSDVLRPDEFEKVLEFTEKRIVEFGKEIIRGEIAAKPFRMNQKSPCSYCKYKAVCRFDWQINEYDLLRSVGKVEAIEKMGAVDE